MNLRHLRPVLLVAAGFSAVVNAATTNDRHPRESGGPAQGLPQPVLESEPGWRPPSWVTAAPSDFGFTLRWESVKGAAYYRVFLRPAHASAETQLPSYVCRASQFIVVGLRPGEGYFFHVSAISSQGEESVLSDPVYGRTGEASRYVVIDRRSREVRLYEGEKNLRAFPAAIGRVGFGGDSVTPVGEYRIVSRTTDPAFEWPDGRVVRPYREDPSNPMGKCFIALDYKVQGRTIGIHGTNDPACIGTLVSGGCVRLHNEDALALLDAVRVGTPVLIED